MRFSKSLILGILTLALLPGCGEQPEPVSSSVTSQESVTFKDKLFHLENTLKNQSPFIHEKLSPPATDQQLQELRVGLGGAKVEYLEMWFSWHNGCSGTVINILPLGRILSIKEALADRKRMMGMPFVDSKRKSAIKLLDDGAGDGFFLDITSKEPRIFYHMQEDPYPQDYGTLPEFLTLISDIHAAGLAKKGSNGTASFDLKQYQKLEEDYLKKIKKTGLQ